MQSATCSRLRCGSRYKRPDRGYLRAPGAATRIEQRRTAALEECVRRVTERLPDVDRIYDREDVGKLCGPLSGRVEALDGDREVADGVAVARTGGHSPGHQQIEVRLGSGLAIITGDNAYLVDPSVTEQVPPGYVTSIPETMEALADIRRRGVRRTGPISMLELRAGLPCHGGQEATPELRIAGSGIGSRQGRL